MKKICSHCRIKKDFSDFYLGASLGGRRSRCKGCFLKVCNDYRVNNRAKIAKKALLKYHEDPEKFIARTRQYALSNEEKYKEIRRRPKSRFSLSASNAKRRGIEWSIDLDDFTWLCSLECFYCDGRLGRTEAGIGLDRINNEKGYTLQNVVSCCTFCNTVKSNKLTLEQTRRAIRAIIRPQDCLGMLS